MHINLIPCDKIYGLLVLQTTVCSPISMLSLFSFFTSWLCRWLISHYTRTSQMSSVANMPFQINMENPKHKCKSHKLMRTVWCYVHSQVELKGHIEDQTWHCNKTQRWLYGMEASFVFSFSTFRSRSEFSEFLGIFWVFLGFFGCFWNFLGFIGIFWVLSEFFEEISIFSVGLQWLSLIVTYVCRKIDLNLSI